MTASRTTVVRGLATAVGIVSLVSVTGLATAAPGDPGKPRFTAGSEGVGDNYFPYSGNGGYDVSHYDLAIDYTPPAPSPAPLEGQLSGVATIDLTATADLDRFNLDLRGMTVSAMTVNGKRATGITPPAPVSQRQTPQPGKSRRGPATSMRSRSIPTPRGRSTSFMRRSIR